MYNSLTEFLTAFSAEFPLLWAMLVLVVIAGTALFLYGFWELVLRWATGLFGSRRKGTGSTRG